VWGLNRLAFNNGINKYPKKLQGLIAHQKSSLCAFQKKTFLKKCPSTAAAAYAAPWVAGTNEKWKTALCGFGFCIRFETTRISAYRRRSHP
jgi:hypothetical protein